MTNFNIFYFTEHSIALNPKKGYEKDNRIIVLYDENDGNYYYYGTRNHENQTKYIQYSGKFYYTRIYEFVDFIDILFDKFSSKITTELHQINIKTCEYNNLNFDYLKEKISRKTELVAYDFQTESHNSIYNYLKTLITHEV
jgi:hypothetical protein